MNTLAARAFIERFRIWLYWCKVRDIVLKWYFTRKIARGVAVLENLDGMLVKAGYRRHERRQFWSEIRKKADARAKLFKRLKK